MKRVWVLVAALGFACDSPTPGELMLVLDTPQDNDGAIEIAVTAQAGFQVTGVAATCRGCRIFTRTVSEQEIRAIVTGIIVDGLFVTLTVSDIRKPDRYAVAVRAGASRTYDVRTSMAGYSVSVAR